VIEHLLSKFANSSDKVIKQGLSKKFILHHLLRSFERDEQHSSVKKLSKLWILRPSCSLQNAVQTSHQARSCRSFNLHHLLRSYERDEQRSSVKSYRSSEFWQPSCCTQLVIKQDFSNKCILHHLLRSFKRDEQHSSVKKFSKLWILTTFLKFANSCTQLVIKQAL